MIFHVSSGKEKEKEEFAIVVNSAIMNSERTNSERRVMLEGS